jgi:portal protein
LIAPEHESTKWDSGRGSSGSATNRVRASPPTLAPYLEMWEQTLDRAFELEEQGIFVEFDTTKFLRGDLLSRYQAYRLAIVTGWMTQNEPRRLEGFDPIPGGDVLLRPMNTQPMGAEAPGSAGPGSDTTGAPAPGGDGDALGGIDPARN